jgi:hypothetical protein
LEALGVEASWTLTAEAREYRESLAVEQALASKTIDETAWMQQQIDAEAKLAPEVEEAAS